LCNGAREITLLGQNVNAFHGDGPDGKIWGLGRLCEAIAKIQGLKRLRYTTSHPRDMDDELLAAHRDIPQLMPFLHLPVQSGSDKLLEAMNRKHTSGEYRRTIDKLRKARPDMAFSSDFITGFPGETDEDFSATLKLVSEITFAQAYSFKYSRRPGTPAAAMPNQIAESVKDARLHELQALLRAQQEKFNTDMIGQTVPVLFENPSEHEGYVFGRTPYMQAVRIRAPAGVVGEEYPARIDDASLNTLTGEAVMN
jgi:tRNA-2-methylthio-N6-dimethylallyladenosine synthase